MNELPRPPEPSWIPLKMADNPQPPTQSKALVFARRSASTLFLWGLVTAIFVSGRSWAVLGLISALAMIATVEYFKMLRAAAVMCFPRFGILLAAVYCGGLSWFFWQGGESIPQDIDDLAVFIAIAGASLFLILGLVRWEDINSGVNWGVVLLYAAAISLGVEMKETGAAEWVAQSVFEGMRQIGATGTFGFNAVISLLTIGVSNTMTAGAAVAVLAPIVLKTAVTAHQDPISAGFITAISSAFGYLTPAAQPAFTIIYASGFLRGSDFFKVGIRMMVLSYIVLMAISVLYWPLLAP